MKTTQNKSYQLQNFLKEKQRDKKTMQKTFKSKAIFFNNVDLTGLEIQHVYYSWKIIQAK